MVELLKEKDPKARPSPCLLGAVAGCLSPRGVRAFGIGRFITYPVTISISTYVFYIDYKFRF